MSIETGLPALVEMCDEPGVLPQLGRQLRDALGGSVPTGVTTR